MHRRVLPVLFVLMMLPAQAHAWWNGDFGSRKRISFNTTAQGVETATDQAFVPVLVRLHTGNFGFADAKPDGADVRFVANDDKTALKYHFESFDGVNELATAWVQVPRLAARQGADYIWVYYGSEKASAGDDAKGSFDPGFAAVLHLSDASAPPRDATANAVPVSGDARPEKLGLIGGAFRFEGGGKLSVGPARAFKAGPANGAALSAWVNPTALAADQVVVQWGGAGGLTLGLANGTPYAQAAGVKVTAAAALPAGGWHHLALSVKDQLTLVVDGIEAGKQAAAAPAIDGAATVGSDGGSRAFTGVIDEVEFSSTARSSDWFKLAALGQASESKLYSLGQDEQAEAAGSSYFSILLHSVTLDGWVVIAILMVMMLISWAVMYTKARFVNLTRKGNQAFQARFAELRADDLMAMDSGDIPPPGHQDHPAAQSSTDNAGLPKVARDAAMGHAEMLRHSSLYRLYHVAMRELKHRFEQQDASGKPRSLSGPAIDAIRASLDAGTVRESQRLNSQMVLLTIAVSGGPFLGLLGTVVGVMITFAAIAAAGDVNVNAIAPGIAAALVATVAGLAVAIPALFGYNYLSIQVKNLSADMAVFNDELITRLAENYSY